MQRTTRRKIQLLDKHISLAPGLLLKKCDGLLELLVLDVTRSLIVNKTKFIAKLVLWQRALIYCFTARPFSVLRFTLESILIYTMCPLYDV